MADAPPPEPQAPARPEPPHPVIARKSGWRLSLVWLVPIMAMVVGVVLTAQTLLQSGPDITIEFRTAEGIQPDRTEVRYKEVVIGRVTGVALNRDRERVIVSVTLDRSAAGLAVKDTQFWVVRPRIGATGVSGLGTLLSGAYIGVDAGESNESQRRFVGLEAAPYVLRGEPGRSFELTARDLGSLDIGSPVYYRRARVGRVVGYALDPERDRISLRLFIEAPNDRLVNQGSRFWNASGVDLTVGANGVQVNTQSIASVLAGGIAFATSPSAAASAVATPAPDDRRFFLFDNEKQALAPPDGPPLRVRMVFEQSVRGLTPGAPIDLLGVEIGTVRSISLDYEPGQMRIPVEVLADIYPPRIGSVREPFANIDAGAARQDASFLARMVDSGLRAQLRSGNLLTGQLYVALAFVPKAGPARLVASNGTLILPTVPSAFADLQPQLADIINRISKIPFDEIGHDVQTTLKSTHEATQALERALNSANATIESLSPQLQGSVTDLRAMLEAAQRALDNLDRHVAQPDAPLQRNANEALIELGRAAQALRVLGDYLQQHPESMLRGKPADPPLSPTPAGARP